MSRGFLGVPLAFSETLRTAGADTLPLPGLILRAHLATSSADRLRLVLAQRYYCSSVAKSSLLQSTGAADIRLEYRGWL